MRTRRALWPLTAFACTLTGFTLGFAQQQQQPTAYWYLTQHQIDFRMADSLGKLLKAGAALSAELKRSGHVLEDRWLLHNFGTEWNLLHIQKFPSWAAIDGYGPASLAAFRKVMPDSTRREALTKAFAEIFQGNAHRDAIYVEIGT